MIECGQLAPDFVLSDQDGREQRLSDYRGQWVIVYFYPKDSTAGCTRQACGFQERLPQIGKNGAQVLGISRDSAASHIRFREKYGLTFPLLSDPDHRVTELYGAWGEKKSYGKVTMGVIRTSYLIDPEGVVRDARGGVRAADNPEDMLRRLEEIRS